MAPVASNASVESSSTGQPPLRIFYDRLAVALLGCLAVLALPIGGVLALAGVFSGWVPLVALALAIASFSTLRGLAVRDRRSKLLKRLETTRTLAMETGRTPSPEPVRKTAVVFDAQPDSNKRAPRLTVQELRAEALRIAHKGAAVQRPEGWEPTQVPLPQYVVANAAQRPAPAPLQASAELKASTGASLRSQEAAARLAEAAGAEGTGAAQDISALPAIPLAPAAEAPSIAPAPVAGKSAPVLKPATAEAPVARPPRAEAAGDRINLDDVMQRRRA
ncbi:hypothetical protein ACIPVK_07540 [Paeniglutamicibacter sp. MACA_103]|uniref:hypothetical protein n=1 Tax=Paeniglutamicibacter sp. MACA_103 TaxID=3377337 RepID=UPI0038957C8D